MIVKAVFEKKIYRIYNWTIPIVENGGRYITGQNLEYSKMIGEKPLSEEELKLYPFVINPLSFYKLPNGLSLDLDDASDQALYNLAILSGKMAKTKAEFKKASHVGYFEDKELEATIEISAARNKSNALAKIFSLNEADINSVALMLFYSTKKEDFEVNMNSSSSNAKQSAMIKLAEKNPQAILNCFKEYNPEVEDDLFIYKLVYYKLIIKTATDFYEASNGTRGKYIGKSINDVKDYLNNKSNFSVKDKFIKLLKQHETGLTVTIPVDIAKQEVDVESKKEMLLSKIKAFMFDSDDENANEKIELYVNTFGKDSKINELIERQNKKIEADIQKQNDSRIAELRANYEGMELEALLKMFNMKGNKFSLTDVAEFSDDKAKIIDYMISKLSENK